MNSDLIPVRIHQELLQPNFVQLGGLQTTGLSGALVWRSQSAHGPAALRCWPAEHPTAHRLAQIHAAMAAARQGGHECIPQIYRNRAGRTFTSDGQRLWELTQWMPGSADYLRAPSDSRLRSAMLQLARLHGIWARCTSAPAAPSPTLCYRHQRMQTWLARAAQLLPAHVLHGGAPPELAALAAETLGQLARLGPHLLAALDECKEQAVEQHFVLRDIWSDHVLFTGEEATGVIDFGAARVDEPAADVARLLGSLEPLDRSRWQMGWHFYHELHPRVELRRVLLLDRVGTLLSAVQWLEWLVVQRRPFQTPQEELRCRWQRLLARLATFQPVGIECS